MDLYDAGGEYRVVLEVPGATKDEVETVPGPVEGTIVVRVKGREERRDGQPVVAERGARPGGVRYERLVPVARDADVARATRVVENGVLVVSVPKRADETKPR